MERKIEQHKRRALTGWSLPALATKSQEKMNLFEVICN